MTDDTQPRANLKTPWIAPDDDGDMLTAAYLSGAHNAKATIQSLREQIAAIDKAVSDAGEPPLTGDNATIVDRIASLGRDILRLHDEKCDALDRIAALKAMLREAGEELRMIADHLERIGDTRPHKDGDFIDSAHALAARIEKDLES